MILVISSLILMTSAVFGTFFLAYRHKINRLGIPILAAGIFFFIYVMQPIYLIWNGDIYYYLDNWQIAKAIFISFIMYLAFLYGWYFGNKGKSLNKSKNRDVVVLWSPRRIYRAGFIIAGLGILIFYLFLRQSGGLSEFYGAVHGAAGAWTEQTAYVYNARYLVYPGLVLMILACLNSKKSLFKWTPVLFFISLTLIHAILVASRGTFFLLAVTSGMTYYLGGGKIPTIKTVIISGIAVGVIVILLVGYRSHLHLGPKDKDPPTFSEAIVAMLDVRDPAVKASSTGDSGFIYHSGIIETVDETQKYNLGVNWIHSITIQMIPRLVWPEKPYTWTVGIDDYHDLGAFLGWTPSYGAFPGIVGGVYRQFGLVSIIFFFVLGWISRHFFNQAVMKKDPVSIVVYVLWYSWGLHLFGQGFGAVIVPYFYILIPTLFILRTFCRKRNRKVNISNFD